MPGVGFEIAAVLATMVAWAGAGALTLRGARMARALDEPYGDPRKVHLQAIPRIGGLAVAAGILAGAGASWVLDPRLGMWPALLLCVMPGLVWGLIEDFSKRGAVEVRLALTAVAAGLGYILLDARISQLHVPGLDNLLVIHAFSFAFTMFAVTGVAHAINVIDGLNGLASVNALLASIGLAVVAWMVGDAFVFSASCVLAASVGGFFLVNYPSGRIFLGDGGAYLIGLLLAALSVLLVHRNSEVSPWFPLVLLAYPIWETLFSMYRRKMHGRSTGAADALHLHSLVYRRLARWKGFGASPAEHIARNSIASACLWLLPAACLVAALSFWNDSIPLVVCASFFAIFYTRLYSRIVQFGLPSWLMITSRPAALPEADGGERKTA